MHMGDTGKRSLHCTPSQVSYSTTDVPLDALVDIWRSRLVQEMPEHLCSQLAWETLCSKQSRTMQTRT